MKNVGRFPAYMASRPLALAPKGARLPVSDQSLDRFRFCSPSSTQTLRVECFRRNLIRLQSQHRQFCPRISPGLYDHSNKQKVHIGSSFAEVRPVQILPSNALQTFAIFRETAA